MVAVSREQAGRCVVSANLPIGRDMRLKSMCSDHSTISPNIGASCDDAARECADNARDLAREPDSRHPILTSEGKPIIFAPGEFGRLAKDANRAVDGAPRDFLRFDFGEMETPLRDILFKSDKWMEQRKDGEKEWGIPGVITQRETEAAHHLMTANIHGDLITYLRGRMISSALPLEEAQMVEAQALGLLGASFAQHQAEIPCMVQTGSPHKERDETIVWGRRAPMGDCEAQDLSLGPLHFKAIDYGDTIRVSERLRKSTKNVTNDAENQCALLHLVDGVMWNRNGRRLGIPELSKILSATEEWGMEEVSHALQVVTDCEGRGDAFARELRNFPRDVLTP